MRKGTIETGRNQTQGDAIVRQLVEPWTNKGRNVTTDNFFTDVKLAEHLLGKRTTLVGTVKRSKTFLPESFRALKSLPLYTSKFGFDEEKTIVNYQGKKRKNVVLLSTMHNGAEVDNTEKKSQKLFIRTTKQKVVWTLWTKCAFRTL